MEITWIRIQLTKLYTIWQGVPSVFTLNHTMGQNLSSVFTLSYPLFVNLPSEVKDTSWDLSSGNTFALGVSSAPHWLHAQMLFTSRFGEALNICWTAPSRTLRTFFVASQNVTLADWNAKIILNLVLHLRVCFSAKRIKFQQIRGCIIKKTSD